MPKIRSYEMKKATKTTAQTPSLKLMGSIVKVRLSVSEGNDRLSILEHYMPQAYATPLHIHKNEDEVFHIFSGRMRFEVGGNIVIAQAGDVVLAPKGVPHRFFVESIDGVHCTTTMRGGDFEEMVVSAASPTNDITPLTSQPPSEDELAQVMAACARNNIDIIGPPLAA
jgi:mannose-6-phosphate isomerase-like protein (cupin superfamily)